MMRATVVALLFVQGYSALLRQGSKGSCDGVECPNIQCMPPFELKTAEASGSCCAICWSDSVQSPEDRSWTKDLTGGIGMNANAPGSCRNVVCLPLTCPQTEQGHEAGRCCTTCGR